MLSEVQLISSVKNKNIPFEQWEKRFTTFPVGNKYEMRADFSAIKPRINVNLATSEEIADIGTADMAELVTRMQSMLLNKDAAQQAYAKISQNSLFDYLK